MSVLFLDSPSFGKADMAQAFEKLGRQIEYFYKDSVYSRTDNGFDGWFDALLEEKEPEFVFSFNYFPAISRCCNRKNVKYISYVYDSPQAALFSCTIANPCNTVFLFDKAMYLELKRGGVNTVHYLPMAANVARLDTVKTPAHALSQVTCDVSFVGSLYNEKNNLFDRMKDLDEYTMGYLNGIMEAQMKVQGYFFIEELLKPDIIKAMSKSMPYQNPPDGVETLEFIYAHYFLARKMTALERQRLLQLISERFPLRLYTHHKPKEIPKADFMGAIDWEESMSAVFKHSKINLNISLRSIRSGIPLRAFDIMGAGGFLLSNYQEDFLDYFVPDQDFVYYLDENDLLSKIEYYLGHEKERSEIARNGYEKVKQAHTYEHRAKEMLKMAGILPVRE